MKITITPEYLGSVATERDAHTYADLLSAELRGNDLAHSRTNIAEGVVLELADLTDEEIALAEGVVDAMWSHFCAGDYAHRFV